jgi:hypothetical protein
MHEFDKFPNGILILEKLNPENEGWYIFKAVIAAAAELDKNLFILL